MPGMIFEMLSLPLKIHMDFDSRFNNKKFSSTDL